MHTILFVAALLLALSVYINGDEHASVDEPRSRFNHLSSDACLLVAGVFCAILGLI